MTWEQAKLMTPEQIGKLIEEDLIALKAQDDDDDDYLYDDDWDDDDDD